MKGREVDKEQITYHRLVAFLFAKIFALFLSEFHEYLSARVRRNLL